MKELTNTLILFIGIFFLNRVQVLHYNTPSHHKKKKEQNILNHSDEIKFWTKHEQNVKLMQDTKKKSKLDHNERQ